MPSVVVVVPIYRENISWWEEVSLLQMNRVLGRYPRVLVAPESLNTKCGIKYKCKIIRFPDENFKDIPAYSNMMLDINFYRQFAAYDYMLLYQLDAFVFSDRLAEFCAMNYDYIGAPVFRFSPMWHALGTSVGNGGLSLRKIPSFLRILAQKDKLWEKNPWTDLFFFEDLFWAFCGADRTVDFRVPPPELALEFAVQDDIMHAYRRMPKWLPFGCHYWNKLGSIRFWGPIVAGYGYDLGEVPQKKLAFPREVILREKKVRRKQHAFSLQPLYAFIHQGDRRAALSLLAGWLDDYPAAHAYWQNTADEFMCLWRVAELNYVRTGDFLWRLLRDTLAEAISRSVVTDSDARNSYLMPTRL